MKKLVGFVVVLMLAGGGWWYYITYGKPVEQPQVVQAAISRGNVTESVSATGTLDPVKKVDVGSQVSGVVKEMYVDYNNIVKQGQLLAELDPSLLDVQVKIQEANIERQNADIANQQVQLEDQKRQLNRTRSLFEAGLQNQQQLEASELSVKTREAQIESAKKQLIQAEASLNQAKMNLSYTKIYSPIDGVVVERKVDKGQTVQASMNTPSFFILATQLDTMKLTAGVDESEIGKVRPGMEVQFNVDAYGQETFYGTVNAVRLNATNQQNVITYPVWIDVPNPQLKLRPSMTANLKIIISTAANVVRIPTQALRFRPNAEIYLALGLTPPAAGAGRAGAAGAAGTTGGRTGGTQPQSGGRQAQPGASGSTPAAGSAPATGTGAAAAAPSGQTAQAGTGSGRGGRGGGGADTSNLTAEQRQQLAERFASSGFGGRSGRSGRAGGQGAGRSGQTAAPVQRTDLSQGGKIDDYFAPLQRTESRGAVWTWNPDTKELKQINLRLGITDGTFSELLSGDVQVGQQVVTGVILPANAATRTTSPSNSNPLFGNQPRGGFGGGGGGRGGGRGGN